MKNRVPLHWLVLSAVVSLLGHCASANSIDWPVLGFTQTITNTFNKPTVIANAGDGSHRMFVAEQSGRIWIVKSNSVLAEPFLNISDRVFFGPEQGLLGVTFPPGFATNSHFYVDYTRQPDGATVISRFFLTPDPNIADTNSEQIIKVIPQPYANHNGGQIAFGPDGYLYVGLGDGGSGGDSLNNAQKTNTALGKLLRIDVEGGAVPYAVPPNNPFVGMPGYAPEIWALGLRNPWRFSFDRSTGDLYIGDVGQNRFEEINFQPAGSSGGQNYGWRVMEGPTNYNVPPGFTNFSTLTRPVAWYDSQALPTFSASVTGGYVYRGPREPRMDGIYFYADFVAGWMWGLKRFGTNWHNQVLFSSTSPFSPFGISTFGEDEQGRLFFANYFPGKIYQIQDTHQVWAPTFSPANGIINSNMVLVNCLTPGAVIRVTTNGLDPEESDPIIPSGGLLQVSSGQTNKLRAFRSGLEPSSVTSAVFTPRVATPTFAPPAGFITNNTLVGISAATPGATIYYTTNGATPTTNSLVYSDPLPISGPITIRAFGVLEGYSDSSVATVTYSAARVATPAFSPAGPAVAYGTLVSISCPTAGSVIYYTLDGSMPTADSPVYSGRVAITNDVTVRAFAVAPGYLDSAARGTRFTLIKAATPQFSSPSGTVTNGSVISISCETSNAIIYYTLDNSDPDTNSTIYSAGFSFTNTVTLRARAFAPLYNPSDIAMASYNFLSLENYVVTTFAGWAQQGFSNGPARLARFRTPYGICLARDGSFYVADSGNHAIRQILSSGEVTTFAGTGIAGHQDGPATNAQFSTPVGISVDQIGNMYVSDWSACNFVRKITNNVVTTLAQLQSCGGAATMWQMETDSTGDIYVGQYGKVHRVSPSGSVSVIAELEYWLWGVTPSLDASTNVYAGVEYRIVKIAPDGSNELFAGHMDVTGRGDGHRLKALFHNPRDIFVDAATNIFVSDTVQIRRIRPDGWVSTLAGTGVAGYKNGPGAVAQFADAAGMCIDTNGNIYVADGGNNCIRKVSPDTAAIGIADDWQRAHFGHVGIDPNGDADHDGMSNYQEFWASTNPLDPASVLVIDATSFASNDRIYIRWQTVANKIYSVQSSTDFVSWSQVGDLVVGDDSIASILDPSPTWQRMQRYYRVVLSDF